MVEKPYNYRLDLSKAASMSLTATYTKVRKRRRNAHIAACANSPGFDSVKRSCFGSPGGVEVPAPLTLMRT